jgi:hypothetical protein
VEGLRKNGKKAQREKSIRGSRFEFGTSRIQSGAAAFCKMDHTGRESVGCIR